jgi:hypothetical protein
MSTEASTADGQAPTAPDTEASKGDPNRPLLLRALGHEANEDGVADLLFDHVVLGRLHWTVVANSLPLIVEEALQVADEEDWAATVGHVLGHDRKDPPGSRATRTGVVIDIATIRSFLRALVDEPQVRDRLRIAIRVALEGAGSHPVGEILKEEVLDFFRSIDDGEWNVVAGQLIAEARAVNGGGGEVAA